MILFRDANRLALTKLKIRIPRLIITVVVASLLFSLCVFVVVIIKGGVQSVESFNSEGLSNRYLVVGNSAVYEDYYSNPEIIKAAEDAQKDLIKNKIAEAKRLGIEYDSESETPWVQETPEGEKFLDYVQYGQIQEIIENIIGKDKNLTYGNFRDIAKQNGAINTYRATSEFGFSGPPSSGAGQIKVIKENKEQFTQNNGTDFNPYGTKGFATIEGSTLRAVDESLLRPFTLPDQSLEQIGDEVPTLVPYSVAEEALGLKSIANDAKPEQKIERIQQVRQSIAGKQINICYRNGASSQQVQDVLLQQQELEEKKDKKDYIKPLVLYDLPKEPCGPVIIKSDSRTVDQKSYDTKQEQFEEKFGKQQPEANLYTVKIVGIVPDLADYYTNSLNSILGMVLSSSVGGGWITTIDVAEKSQYKDIVSDINNVSSQQVQFIAELPNAEAQQKFIKEQSCNINEEQFIQGPPGVAGGFINDPSAKCKQEGKYFVYSSYGNNAAAVKDFEKGFYQFFKIALIVIAVLSSIILMGIMGRIIADSRRETAVFRSIGATRLDISTIYSIYAFIISSFVAVSAATIGYIAAIIFNNHFSPQVTPNALLVFNSTDIGKKFSFIGLDAEKLIIIVGVIFIAGIFGLILPLVSNLRRSPLKDMRDEN